MKIEVLLATMNQKDLSFLDKINLKTDALIINQGNECSYIEKSNKENTIRMISNKERGLSKSRNEALLHSKGDICLICDDDVSYVENYEELVLKAFVEIPEADIIIFETNMLNYYGKIKRRKILRVRKSPFYKTYGSVRIAFKREVIQKANVWFNIEFGAGSKYGAGEESIFLKDLRKKGLRVYEYPAIIADVDYSTSTWFTGYNEKYYFDKGAYLAASHKYLKHIYKYYYWFKLRKYSNINIIKYINNGIKDYKNN